MTQTIYFDTNIILDYLLVKRLYHQEAKSTMKYCMQNSYNLVTSCDIITTIYYIDSKVDRYKALQNIRMINKFIKVIDFSNQEVDITCELMLVDSDYNDLEDTLQYILAKKVSCDVIISNDNGFISKEIPLLTSRQFVEKYINE